MTEFKDHPLAEAARNNDAIAEEHGVEAAAEMIGLDMDALMHVADQRALRLTILATEGPERLAAATLGNKPTPIALGPEQKHLHRMFMLAALDGICIGWKASSIDV